MAERVVQRAVVFGGLGFIGSAVVDRYLANGVDVTVVDSLAAACVPVEQYDRRPGCTVHSISAEEFCADSALLSGADVAVHAASAVGPAGILQMGGVLGAMMIETTHRIIQACKEESIPLIYFSSAEVYGRSGLLAERDTLHTPAGYNVRVEYALAKTLGEAMVANCLGRSGYAAIVRPFNVVGRRQLPNGGFVFPTFGDQVVDGRPLTVFADGIETRAFTSVHDVARFVCDFGLQALAADELVFNVGNPENEISVGALAEMFISRAGSSSTIDLCDPKDIHGPLYELAHSIEKIPVLSAATALGWQPTESLTELVDECIDGSRSARD